MSRPRHFSKGAQPVSKAVYIAVVVVINTRPRWASILGPNTPRSSVLPSLDHCVAKMSLGLLVTDHFSRIVVQIKLSARRVSVYPYDVWTLSLELNDL